MEKILGSYKVYEGVALSHLKYIFVPPDLVQDFFQQLYMIVNCFEGDISKAKASDIQLVFEKTITLRKPCYLESNSLP